MGRGADALRINFGRYTFEAITVNLLCHTLPAGPT